MQQFKNIILIKKISVKAVHFVYFIILLETFLNTRILEALHSTLYYRSHDEITHQFLRGDTYINATLLDHLCSIKMKSDWWIDR